MTMIIGDTARCDVRIFGLRKAPYGEATKEGHIRTLRSLVVARYHGRASPGRKIGHRDHEWAFPAPVSAPHCLKLAQWCRQLLQYDAIMI